MTTSGRTGPELRIADSEREAAVSALGEHYAAGRLTKEEFDERADAAWAARTASGLWPLFDDLPRPSSPRPAALPRPPAAAVGHHGRSGLPVPPVLIGLLVLVVVLHPFLLVVALGWLLWSRNARPGPQVLRAPHGLRGPHRLR